MGSDKCGIEYQDSPAIGEIPISNRDRCSCMGNRIDMTGQRFGRLTVVLFVRGDGTHSYWSVKCDCGNDRVVARNSLQSGRTKSCGCLHRENKARTSTKHGKHLSRVYNTYMMMRARCSNPNATGYECYGGRGITVCDRWNNSFQSFLDDMGEPPDGTSIDRIDVNGHYEPTNCRWATRSEQQANRRNTVRIDLNGEVKTMHEWSESLDIPVRTIRARIAAGRAPQEVLSKERLGKCLRRSIELSSSEM